MAEAILAVPLARDYLANDNNLLGALNSIVAALEACASIAVDRGRFELASPLIAALDALAGDPDVEANGDEFDQAATLAGNYYPGSEDDEFDALDLPRA